MASEDIELEEIENKVEGEEETEETIGENNEEDGEEKNETGDGTEEVAEEAPKVKREDEEMFKDEIPDEYRCQFCQSFLYSPTTMKICKHTLCASCYTKGLRGGNKCPICKEFIEKNLPQNKKLMKGIAKMNIKCLHFKKTCEWEGVMMDMSAHMKECQYHVISCVNGCGIDFERQHETNHLENDCSKRSIACKFCEDQITPDSEEDHIRDVCQKIMVDCPNGCSIGQIARGDFEQHFKEVCDKQERPCPYSIHGCEEVGLKDKLDSHIKSSQDAHMNMMNKTVCELYKVIGVKTAQVIESQAKLMKLESQLHDTMKVVGSSFIWRIDSYMNKFNQAKTGKRFTFFSEPFYSHKLGYRLGASICPNGDGKMSGKYLSIFVCIYKGENDSLLPWPFSSPITITMLDQNPDVSQRKSIEYVLKPNVIDDNDMFLKRPEGERNPSFGALRFCNLNELENGHFIADDILYLMISVCGEKIPA